MALPIPPLQDIVRLTGLDVAETAQNYRNYLRSTGPVWGYNPAKRLAKSVFSLQMTREAAVNACGQGGHVLGRRHNKEVGGLIWDVAKERGQFMCHDLTPRLLQLRSDFSVKVDPLFFFIEDGRPVLFYLQPRRGHVPGLDGLRLLASAIHSLFATDEMATSDLLLLDLSMPFACDERVAAVYDFEALPPLSTTQTEHFFQRFVDAYDVVTNEGAERKTRRPSAEKDRGDDLFDPPPAE